MENTRYCARCDTEHDLDNFHKNSRKKDGLHTYCKDCRRAEALVYHHKNYIKSYGKRGRPRKESRIDNQTKGRIK